MSVAYIGSKSRTEKPTKTKIGSEVVHITYDLDTTLEVKKVKDQLAGAGAYCGGLPHSLFVLPQVSKLHVYCCCRWKTCMRLKSGSTGLMNPLTI